MSYKVQFIGLVCFYRENGGRLALLPDGRQPDAGIDPHHASIVVHPDSIVNADGWDDVDRDEEGVFPLSSPCTVTIEDADAPGALDVSGHDNKLPHLRQIDPNFEIDPDRAQTIARMRISRGTLKAYHVPDGRAVVSELVVPHDGDVTISVATQDGATRSIRVQAGTEIVIANMARGVYRGAVEHEGHFKIYEKLSVRPVSLSDPTTVPEGLTELQTRNPLFRGQGAIGLYAACSNTGCC